MSFTMKLYAFILSEMLSKHKATAFLRHSFHPFLIKLASRYEMNPDFREFMSDEDIWACMCTLEKHPLLTSRIKHSYISTPHVQRNWTIRIIIVQTVESNTRSSHSSIWIENDDRCFLTISWPYCKHKADIVESTHSNYRISLTNSVGVHCICTVAAEWGFISTTFVLARHLLMNVILWPNIETLAIAV